MNNRTSGFKPKSRIDRVFGNGGSVDAETQAKIDKIEKFINNPDNQKNDPATVEKFKSILASIKPKTSAPAEPKAEPKKPASTSTSKNVDSIKQQLKDWYTKTYPTDDLGIDITDRKTFEDLYKAIENGVDVYSVIGVGDSLVRERLFEQLAKIKGKKYSEIYDLWLDGMDDDEDESKKSKEKSEPKSKAGRPKGTTKPKSEPKSEPKLEPKEKPSKGVKVTGSSTVTVDGKEMDMNSSEFCDYLLKQFRERREKSKNAPKKKTASVMAKITANVEKSVVQAIKSSVASNKKEIEKNPNFFVKKVEKLETSTKSFLESMKEVLGDDFKQGEIASTMKSIEELTESLIAKYKTK